MKKIILILLITLCNSQNEVLAGRRCTGSSSCNACKNCEGCKYCNEGGGTCGVCSSGASSNEVYSAPTPVEDNSSNMTTTSETEIIDSIENEDLNSEFEADEPQTKETNWVGWFLGIGIGAFVLSILFNKKK
jgi:hypothetical protein